MGWRVEHWQPQLAHCSAADASVEKILCQGATSSAETRGYWKVLLPALGLMGLELPTWKKLG